MQAQLSGAPEYSAIGDLYDYMLSGGNNIYTVAQLVAEALLRGEKVYLTQRAANQLKSILEKHGLTLVPANHVEPRAIIIDLDHNRGSVKIIARKDAGEEWLQRTYSLCTFVEALEKHLKRIRRIKLHLLQH